MKIHYDRGDVLAGEVSITEVPSQGIFWSGKCPSRKCQSGICPQGSATQGNVQSGNCLIITLTTILMNSCGQLKE